MASLHAALLMLCCLFVILACVLLWHVNAAAKKITQAATDADRSMIIIGGAATDLQKTLAVERQAATEQIRQGQAFIDEGRAAELQISASAVSLNQLVRNTDRSMNDPHTGLLPALAAIPQAITPFAQSLERQAEGNLADLDDSEKSLDRSIGNFDTITTEIAQQLPPVLGEIQQTSVHVTAISSNTQDATAELAGTAKDFHAFVHRETTPARGVWHTIKYSLSLVIGPLSQLATAAK